MSDFLWWRDGVIYQIYPRSFADSNGDGTGDLEGLIARLDHLNGAPDSLGVDAIWLSPIYPSPGHDFGYDVSDYEAIDPLFGSLEAFDRLVAEAHRRGIRVVMDMVLNHTSHEHPWFKASRSSRSNPQRDWYLWADPAPGGGPPSNWQAVFGGPAWEWDPASSQYYYHMFLKEQPDLNWRNREVRERIWQVFRFWMDRGVDGFRLDVVNAYFKDDQHRDNPFKLGLRAYDRQRHQYDLNRPELEEALREMRQVVDAWPERMLVGEVMGNDPDMAARYCGNGLDQLHMAFNFDFMFQPWRPEAMQKSIEGWERRLHCDAWPCYFLSNHDFSRHLTRFGGPEESDARAKVAATLLLTQRGTPFLYYGEEIGLRDTPIPRREIVDPPGKRFWPFYKGRDAVRTPMPWDSSPGAGFTTGRPWLRFNADHAARNVEAQRKDPRSILHFYRALIRLRRESVALRRGAWVPMQHQPKEALVYLRRTEAQVMLVALNFGKKPARVQVDGEMPAGAWKMRISSHPGTHDRVRGKEVALEPFEGCVLEAV